MEVQCFLNVQLGVVLTTVIERITHFYSSLRNKLFVSNRTSPISRLKSYFILHRLMEGTENFTRVWDKLHIKVRMLRLS